MKKNVYLGVVALVAAFMLSACIDDSGIESGSSNLKIQEYKNVSRLPSDCDSVSVAKVAEDFYACYENEWVKIADSSMVEKIKDGLDDELIAQIEEFLVENEKKSPESSSASEKESKDKSSSSSVKGGSSSSSSSQDCKDKDCEDEGSEKCGDETYDPKTQICEDGKVLKKCGRRFTYDPKTQICEDGYVYEKCTEDSGYDPETQVCIDDEVLKKCTEDSGYDPETQVCIDDKVLKKCTEDSGYDPETQDCQDGKVVGKCKDAIYDLKTQICIKDVVLEKCGDEDGYDPKEQYCKDGNTPADLLVCGTGSSAEKYNPEEQFCAEYKGEVDRPYKYVKIGSQIWMAENVNHLISGESFCYEGKEANCNLYGRHYSAAGAEKACPTGWKLPSKSEFENLVVTVDVNLGGTYYEYNSAGKALKEGGSSGFDLLLAGWKVYQGEWRYLGEEGSLWTATSGSDFRNYFKVNKDNNEAKITSANTDNGKIHMSVRCIKDTSK